MSGQRHGSDDLQRAFRGLAEPAETASGCPDRDMIWKAQAGSLAREEAIRVVEHTGQCASCAEAWRLAHSMGAMEGPPTVSSAGRWGLLAAAAVAVVAIGLTIVVVTRQEAGAPVLRSGESNRIESLVPEDRPLPAGELRLRWSGGAEGALYAVRLTTEDFRTLATVEGLKQQEYLVPVDLLADVEPGTRLLWRVKAFLPGGTRITSETFFVQIE